MDSPDRRTRKSIDEDDAHRVPLPYWRYPSDGRGRCSRWRGTGRHPGRPGGSFESRSCGRSPCRRLHIRDARESGCHGGHEGLFRSNLLRRARSHRRSAIRDFGLRWKRWAERSSTDRAHRDRLAIAGHRRSDHHLHACADTGSHFCTQVASTPGSQPLRGAGFGARRRPDDGYLLIISPEQREARSSLAIDGIVLTNSSRHPTSALARAEGTDTSFDWGYVRIYRRPKRSKACTRPMSASPRTSIGSCRREGGLTRRVVMADTLYPAPSRELSDIRKRLAPDIHDAFQAFSQKVFADGALSGKTKQLIAVAVAHVTQCPYCIKGHTTAALRAGASREELMEAIWVAAEMRAGGAYAHSILAIEDMERVERRTA